MKKYAITGALLIDGNGQEPLVESVVLINGERIQAVGTTSALSVPENYIHIDASGKVLLPGLIDAHVHLYMGEHDLCIPGSGLPLGLADHPCMRVLKSFEYATHTLLAGFTTVRDAGDITDNTTQLSKAIKQGIVPGPRIIASNQHLSVTGGHLAPYPAWLSRTDHINNACDGTQDVLKAVRHQIQAGADWIKFFATGGISDTHNVQEFSDEEMNVIVSEAHRKSKKVFAHCQYIQGTLAAVKAGIDSVEHGTQLNDEIIDEMLKRGTWLVPTICVLDASAFLGKDYGLPESYSKKAEEFYHLNCESLRRAHERGVKIAFGSDSGFNAQKHGCNAREFAQYALTGFSPMEAIVCATHNNAEMLGLLNDIGTVEAGKLADLILVDRNPLNNIRVFENVDAISMVMRSGIIYKYSDDKRLVTA